MLKKEYRLRKNADFRKVYRSAKSVSTKYLVLYPKMKKGEDIMRIAVTYENGEIFQHFGKTEQFQVLRRFQGYRRLHRSL